MTEVSLNYDAERQLNYTHGVGNWYFLPNGRGGATVYILTGMHGKMTLVNVENGHFYRTPVKVKNTRLLTRDEWREVAGTSEGEFVYIPSVDITI